MDNIQLSIIVPVYNSENYLEKCVGSILNQTFREFELILVDDASTDTSGKICDQLVARDERVTVVHHETNKGLSLSREEGLKISKGEWISFVDNDDFLSPYMYEHLMKHSNKGDMICIRGEDKRSDEIDNAQFAIKGVDAMIWDGPKACEVIYAKELDLGFIEPVWGKIIKKSLLKQVLLEVASYREKLHWVFMEDVLYTPLLFFYAKQVVYFDELMYMHRRISNNLSSTLIPKEYHYEAVYAGDVLLQFFKEKEMMKVYNEYLLGFFMLVLSTWYKVWKNEPSIEKKQLFEKQITKLYEKYVEDIRKVKPSGMYQFVEKTMVLFFRQNRVLWGRTIGMVYFEIGRRLTY